MVACFSFMCFCGYSWKENNGSLASKFAPISFVTGAWFSMFYAFLFHQSYTHFCAYKAMIVSTKKKGGKESINLMKLKAGFYDLDTVAVVNTTVRNTIEQSITFIPLLWLCAVLGAGDAKTAGWVWVLTRSFYPFVYAMGAPWFFLSTLPGYAVQFYLAYHLTSAIPWPQ